MSRTTCALHLVAACVLLAACSSASKAPLLDPPSRFDAECGSKQVRYTGLMSVVTSTDDKIVPGATPTSDSVRAAVRAAGGAIAYWNDQRLLLPRTAQAVGESDGYVHLRAAAVPLAPPDALTRRIDLLLRAPGGNRWVELTAYDVQNVCVEGQREG